MKEKGYMHFYLIYYAVLLKVMNVLLLIFYLAFSDNHL